MMRITNYYKKHLPKHVEGQKDVPFLDIHMDTDNPFFFDYTILETLDGKHYKRMKEVIDHFMETMINHYRNGNKHSAKRHLKYSHESNEFHLGYSFESKGTGTSDNMLDELFDEIDKAGLFQSRRVQNPMDIPLFIDDIAEDRISDLMISLVRKQLAAYTVAQCKRFGIPLSSQKWNLGHTWSPSKGGWVRVVSEAPTYNGEPVLFIPKEIVSHKYQYNAGDLLKKIAYERLQKEHSIKNTSVHQMRKRKNGYVSKKVIDKVERKANGLSTKEFNRSKISQEMLQDYKAKVRNKQLGTNGGKLSDNEIEMILQYVEEKKTES